MTDGWLALNRANWNEVFDDMAPGLDGRPGWFAPHDDTVPLVMDDPTDYVDPAARLSNSRQVGWVRPVGKALDALHGARLRLDRLEEHPRIAWRMFRCLVQGGEDLWRWPDKPRLPLSLGLHATRKTYRRKQVMGTGCVTASGLRGHAASLQLHLQIQH